ncbi:hypothetical protein INT48_003091 [Thamnidium elegans]|uniref:PHD-type domain-containing protein n=1 Tax=Thamnidium elegans TaxID=101142 RepID=A0A8H7SWN5_9FUNG|nr:hypothetical protein INT48_003091 [Thamnidium elegans]
MMEGRNVKDELTQNIRPMDVNTKRYSVPQNFKSSFYAIHHIQRADSATENTEPPKPKNSPSPSSPSSTTMRSRKRPTSDPTKTCKRSRSINKVRKSSTQDNTPLLYQTCVGLWPENKTLEEYSYDNIKSLSNLLKVRLCQAKFKMMAKLDGDNELFTFLADEYVTPKHKLPCVIKLNQRKQHKSSLSVVGNGKNLFSRNDPSLDPSKSVPAISENTSTITITSTETKRKRRRKKSHNTPNPVKVTRRSKKRSAAADIPPVTLSDGSTVYVCEPCHKKYKNRNGLSYHLQRCKYRTKEEKEGSGLQEESIISCICTKNTDEHGTMVQCDKCQIWLHSECVGLTEDALDDAFHCASCKEKISTDLLQSLIDTAPAEDSMSSQDQINKHLHELFCQTPPDDGEEGDDDEEDVFGMALDDNSEALHVWDDFSFSSTLEKSNNEPWNLMEDDYENDNPSSSWTMNDMALFSQPPSLLFSDPMSSTLDDVTTPVHPPSESTPKHDSTTPLPLSETTPNSICEASSVYDATTPTVNPHTPVHTADGLWFQFANFDDDYQCET